MKIKFLLILIFFLTSKFCFAQEFADVLTPAKKRNTPDLKLAFVLGLNLSNFSNDRFLDNSAFDVGNISGEYEVYGGATGFGFNVGSELEIPINSILSYFFLLNYSRANFSSSGNVEENCFRDTIVQTAITKNNFEVAINYLSFSPNLKLRFSNSYIGLGLGMDYAINSNYIATREFLNHSCLFADKMPKHEINSEIPNTVRLHYTLRVAYGWIYQLSNSIEWSPEVVLNFGIYSINKSPNSDLGIYSLNSSFRFSF